jgi:hypothetical protein
MNQYFIRYTLKWHSNSTSFSTTVDTEIGATADITLTSILDAVRKGHNAIARQGSNPAYEGITNDDIIVQVLTKLN